MPLTAAAIKVLIGKGMSAEDLLDVAEAMESTSGSVPRTLEKRRAFDRERQARRRAEERAARDNPPDIHVDRPPDAAPPRLPQRDNQTPSTPPRSSLRSESVKRAEKAFADFWEVVPRRIGKAEAKRKFVKAVVGGVDAQTIIAAAHRWAAKAEKEDEKFVPHPATWLHQGRFEDEDRAAPAARENLPAGSITAAGVKTAQHSPQGRAWQAARGGKVPWDTGNGFWYFPTEWPPGHGPPGDGNTQGSLLTH